ncbi:Capping enzyme RNA triphosphatase 1 [Trypanosoma cruzi]|uniref:mRNA 5'-phosphatase n=1 Tax=Trypanosoma cruzi TaxID=5693 RepID=A0A2V2X351_TRYCR|nr:Capping enzyme RNA triphosphatase 1 [Trypanosoma cruzi]
MLSDRQGISRHEVVSMGNAEQRAVAKALFDAVNKHLSNPFIEVEMRLGQFKVGEDALRENTGDQNGAQTNGLRIVDANFTACVSTEDYERIKTYLMTEMGNSSMTRSVTHDVSLRGWRHTYATDEDGNPTRCVSIVRKKRILVKNIVVPLGAYNLRFAVSTETPGDLRFSGAGPRAGHTRLKDRLSITDGMFRYDMTQVTEKGVLMHEVEIEGVFSSHETQLTESWLEELLSRAMRLATLRTNSTHGVALN